MFRTTLPFVRRTLKYENALLNRIIATISTTTPQRQKQNQDITGEPSWENAKDYSEIPGPKALPIVGNIWRFMPVVGQYSLDDMTAMAAKLNEKYGDFVKLSGMFTYPDMVFTFNPKDIEKTFILENHMPVRILFQSVIYYRQHYKQDVFKDVMGVAMAKDGQWYRERSMLNPVMLKPGVIKQYVPEVEDITDEFVKRLRRIRTKDNRIPGEFRKEVNRWSLESIGNIALDARLDTLSDKHTAGAELIEALDHVIGLFYDLDMRPSLWKYMPTADFKRMVKNLDIQFDITKRYLDDAIKRIEENKRKGIHRTKELSVLEKLLEIDHNLAIVTTIDMIAAAVDTTTNSLMGTLYYLSNNKSKQDKLRDEIFSLLPDDSYRLNDKNVDQLPYLKACIKEAARLYPVVPNSGRVLTEDRVIGGYRLKKGTLVMFPLMYISNSERHFPRPTEYIPERWLRDNEDSELSYKKSHPFCVIPFGFGARACIGRRFAEMEMVAFLVSVIKNFDISYDGPPPKRVMQAFSSLNETHFVFNDYKRAPMG